MADVHGPIDFLLLEIPGERGRCCDRDRAP
jgi:hypothetical protein